jgi:hypothetical protein
VARFGVVGIGSASLLADAGQEIPTALLPSLLTSSLGAPASALGMIEGASDGLAGMARLGGGALADDPQRKQAVAVGGYATTSVLSGAIGSSIYNIGAVLALTVLVAPHGIPVPDEVLAADLWLLVVATAATVPVFLSGKRITRIEGGLFVVTYIGYLAWLLLTRT